MRHRSPVIHGGEHVNVTPVELVEDCLSGGVRRLIGGVHSLTLDASGNLYVTDNGSGNPPYRVDIFSKAQVATKQGSVASAASVYIPGQSASGSVTDRMGNGRKE